MNYKRITNKGQLEKTYYYKVTVFNVRMYCHNQRVALLLEM